MSVNHSGDEDITDELARLGLLAAVMPDGYAVVSTAGDMAAIVTALPADAVVTVDPLLRAIPGWEDLPDTVTAVVARLAWLVEPDPDTSPPACAGFASRPRWIPTVEFGRRILTHDDRSAADATVVALPADRAAEALDSGRLDVFLVQLSRVLTQWADAVAGEASDEVSSWLEGLSPDTQRAGEDHDQRGQFEADVAHLRASLWSQAQQLRQTALTLAAIARRLPHALS
jgi:hypothetical protein